MPGDFDDARVRRALGFRDERRLKCSRCGAHPDAMEAKYTAKLGGTHYRRFNREMPSTGKGLDVAQSCGKWVEE